MDGSTLPPKRRSRAVSPESSQPLDEDFGTADDDSTDYEGQSLTVSYGKEHFQPERFQGFDVGPFEMQVIIKAGETPLAAKRRAMRHLEKMAEEEFHEKLPRFRERVRRSGGTQL